MGRNSILSYGLEFGALDYLLKPFASERFHEVLQRVEAAETPNISVVSRARKSLQGPDYSCFNRKFERVQGADDYVTVHALNKEYLVSVRLSELQAQLPDGSFLKIHRSHLVNLELVTSIVPFDAGRFEEQMKSGVRIVASRTSSAKLGALSF